jgi:hypothetical protein
MVTQTWTWVFPTFYCSQKTYGERNSAIPIPPELRSDTGDDIQREKVAAQTNVWKVFAREGWQSRTWTTSTALPFWWYQSYGQRESVFNVLGIFYHSKWFAATDQEPERMKRRFLWWLMRYTRVGDETAMDIFPFITYDTSAQKKLKEFSICWRLFRYRKEGQQRSLDILFIPLRWSAAP